MARRAMCRPAREDRVCKIRLSMSHPLPPLPSGASAVQWNDPARQSAFLAWLAPIAAAQNLLPASLRPASADASFRRYLRLDAQDGSSRIVMDAPPDKEDCRPFVHVQELMQAAGLPVPQIHAWDEAHGFMLLSDLGGQTAIERLDEAQPAAAHAWYLQAVDLLLDWQKASRPGVLPAYDDALLRRELQLFPDWYIAKHRGVTLDDKQQASLQKVFDALLANNLAQPQVYVHRDYHSRNLMVLDAGNPGILDFQDAVYGPITYDLVSLLRDAYVIWDEDIQLDYAVRFWEKARKAGLPVADDFGDYWRQFEWMGLQRHLKVLGIFARLALRDGKRQYLDDIPRVWTYAHRVASRYQGLGPLARLLEQAEAAHGGTQTQVGYTF